MRNYASVGIILIITSGGNMLYLLKYGSSSAELEKIKNISEKHKSTGSIQICYSKWSII